MRQILDRYLSQKIGVEQAVTLLKVRRRQFFKLLKDYQEKTKKKPSHSRTQFIVSLLCIIAAGFWAYHNSFSGAFVFDDLSRIRDNLHIRHLWPIREVLRSTSRPLVELTFAVNYALGGTQVFGYHIVNLFIHLCAALVLFGIIRRTFWTESLRDRYGESATGLALAIALLWVVHPLQTQSVTYLIQRAESLMGLCYLLVLYCFIREVTSDSWRGWYVAAIISCSAGMAAKPIMVTAPLIVLLYDRTFISGTFRQALSQRKSLYLCMTITWGLLAILLSIAPPDAGAGFTIRVSPLTYASTQPGVLLHYLKLSLWPKLLCLDYFWPEARMLKEILKPMLVIGPLVILTLWALYRRRHIGFLGAWFFLILAPTSSFIPILDFAVEHRMYLPLAAVIGLVVLSGYELLVSVFAFRQHLRRITAVGCITISVMLLSLMTIQRNKDYLSEETIWRDTISKSPKNVRAYGALGLVLAGQGHLEEAKTQFIQALQLNSDFAKAHDDLGIILDKQGFLEEAKSHLIQALQLDPNFAEAHSHLGLVLGKQGFLEEAKSHLIQALQLDPNFAEAHSHLGLVLGAQGRFEEAKSHLIQALQLDPNFAEAHSHLGAMLEQQGHKQEAITHYREALRLQPDFTLAQENLRRVLKMSHTNSTTSAPTYLRKTQ